MNYEMKRNDLLILFLLAYLLGGMTMPRGAPDYGNNNFAFSVSNIDNNDIVTSILGISRLDAVGRVMFVDDFQSGFNRWIETAEQGWEIIGVQTATKYYFTNYGGIKLDPVQNTGVATLHRNFIGSGFLSVGVEFSVFGETNCGDVYVYLMVDTSDTVQRWAEMRIKATTGVISIFSNGVYNTIYTPHDVAFFFNRWITIKLIANFDGGYYKKLLVAGNSFDISSYPLKSVGGALDNHIHVEFANKGISATLLEPVTIGYVVITADEP